jgi:hypothetical protein
MSIANLCKFIEARELIRVKKEAGDPKPWTDDPMFLNYRFCNVRREDDKVTRWIKANWRDPYEGHPNMARAMLLARMVNWPDTLAEIGFPEEWHAREYMDKIGERMRRGDKTWTGAYMITAEHDGTPKHVSVCKTVDALHYDLGDTCLSAWAQLQLLPRIGSFMAAQVVADLKHTHVLRNAPDTMTFCAPGPGSQRGLSRTLGIHDTEWSQPEFQAQVSLLAYPITAITGLVLDNQDIQNCLCEFGKYVRGSSRSRYNGY